MITVFRRPRGRVGALLGLLCLVLGLTATARADTPTPPAAVLGLTATPAEHSVALRWTDPADPGVTSIVIRRNHGNGAPVSPSDGAAIAVLPAAGTTFTDIHVNPQLAYTYAVFTVGAAASSFGVATLSVTTLPISWHDYGDVDPDQGGPGDVSCPASTFCMLVDNSGHAVEYSNGVWHSPVRLEAAREDERLTAVSCSSSAFCAATGLNGSAFLWRSGKWSAGTQLASQLVAVSCATASFCLAATQHGRAFRWNGTHWTATKNFGNSRATAMSVSCLSAKFCMLVGGSTSSNHTDDWRWTGTAWTAGAAIPRTTRDAFSSVSCTATTFCMLTDDSGQSVRWSGHSWTAIDPYALDGMNGVRVSCRSAASCVAVGTVISPFGEAVSSRYNGSAWGKPVAVASSQLGAIVSCASSTWCAEVDTSGSARIGNGTRWGASTFADVTRADLVSASCVTTSFCIATDTWGNYLRLTSHGWSAPHRIGAGAVYTSEVSCITTTHCLTLDQAGRVWTYDGTGWRAGPATSLRGSGIPGAAPFDCASASYCVTTGGGRVATFNGASWSAPRTLVSDAQPVAVSCSPTRFCGALILSSTYGKPDGLYVDRSGTWSRALSISFTLSSSRAVCADPQYCVVADGNGLLTWSAGRAKTVATPSSGYNYELACTSSSFCLAVDVDGNAAVLDGTILGRATSAVAPGSPELFGVSCHSVKLCVAVGPFGVSVGT